MKSNETATISIKKHGITAITMQIEWEAEEIKKFFENRQKSLDKIDLIMKLEKVQNLIEESRRLLKDTEISIEEIKEIFKLKLKSLVLTQVIIKCVTEEKPLSDEVVADMISDELVDNAIKIVLNLSWEMLIHITVYSCK